jgi:ribosomal silencing factor RsfS
MIISCMVWLGACSSRQTTSLLDDIARDTYEKRTREQRMEKRGDPTYVEPPTYDQYQKGMADR